MTPRTRTSPWLCLLAVLAIAPAGCGVLGKHREKHIKQMGVVGGPLPKELDMVSLPPHVVEPPDELEISVRPASLLESASSSSTRTVNVQTDGTIDLGFLGDVNVAGLRLDEVELKVALHLGPLAAQKKITEPIQVSARLINGKDSKRYYVLGAVNSQASFPINGNETVVDAILAAGLRSNSLPEKAYLVRPHPNGGVDQVYRIEWENITQHGNTMTNYQVLPGDRIYVPGGKPPSLLGSLLGGG